MSIITSQTHGLRLSSFCKISLIVSKISDLNYLNCLKLKMGEENKEDVTKEEPKICCDKENLPSKLRILAIHGYRQNGEVFKNKTGAFRKMVHKWAQFTYITAPHKVKKIEDAEDVGQSGDEQEQYGWFFNRDDLTFRGIRKGGPAIGFEESLQFIEEVFKTEGPFDGLLGFSQGACFVGLLCDLQSRGMLPFKFDFAIMSSGFKSGSLPHLKYYADTISIPTLHIFGESDAIIPTEMSVDLANCFNDPLVVTHPGGHYLPATAAQKHSYQSFFKILRKEIKQ